MQQVNSTILIIFLILVALVITNYTSNIQHQRNSCKKDNIAGMAANTGREGVATFEILAARARERSDNAEDQRTAQGYRELAARIKLVPQINCDLAFSWNPFQTYKFPAPKPMDMLKIEQEAKALEG